MALSVREQILAALAAKLGAIVTGGVAVTFYRNRRKAIAQGAWPALNQIDGGHGAPEEVLTPGISQYTLDVELEGEVGATPTAAMTEAQLGPALSDLYAASLKAALADRTLGGLCIDIHEGALAVDPDRGEGKAPAGAFSLALTIDFWTRNGDPYTIGP
jgi:hypothetical protein